MRIAASTTKGGLDDRITDIFGRAESFTIVDVKDGKINGFEVVKNENTSASGAGIAASQLMVDKDVDVVLTGMLGPNAYNVLTAVGIKVYKAAGMKVDEAINKLLNNELEEITAPSGGKGRGMGLGGVGRRRGVGKGMGRGRRF